MDRGPAGHHSFDLDIDALSALAGVASRRVQRMLKLACRFESSNPVGTEPVVA